MAGWAALVVCSDLGALGLEGSARVLLRVQRLAADMWFSRGQNQVLCCRGAWSLAAGMEEHCSCGHPAPWLCIVKAASCWVEMMPVCCCTVPTQSQELCLAWCVQKPRPSGSESECLEFSMGASAPAAAQGEQGSSGHPGEPPSAWLPMRPSLASPHSPAASSRVCSLGLPAQWLSSRQEGLPGRPTGP